MCVQGCHLATCHLVRLTQWLALAASLDTTQVCLRRLPCPSATDPRARSSIVHSRHILLPFHPHRCLPWCRVLPLATRYGNLWLLVGVRLSSLATRQSLLSDSPMVQAEVVHLAGDRMPSRLLCGSGSVDRKTSVMQSSCLTLGIPDCFPLLPTNGLPRHLHLLVSPVVCVYAMPLHHTVLLLPRLLCRRPIFSAITMGSMSAARSIVNCICACSPPDPCQGLLRLRHLLCACSPSGLSAPLITQESNVWSRRMSDIWLASAIGSTRAGGRARRAHHGVPHLQGQPRQSGAAVCLPVCWSRAKMVFLLTVQPSASFSPLQPHAHG